MGATVDSRGAGEQKQVVLLADSRQTGMRPCDGNSVDPDIFLSSK